jgi:hypothetical protein
LAVTIIAVGIFIGTILFDEHGIGDDPGDFENLG